MTADRPERDVERRGTGYPDRLRHCWRALGRGWQASLLGVLVVLVAYVV